MNKIIKKILLVTKGIRYFFDPITFKFTNNSKNLIKLKDSLKGKPILIVANGPSLNKTPLSKFHTIFSIGLNKINLIFNKTEWRPDIVITTNSLVAWQHWKSMKDTQIPHYLSWNARWVMPIRARHFFNFFLNNKDKKFQKDISLSVGAAGSVTYAALQFAYYTGASPVIIVGLDHNFKHTGSPLDYQKSVGDDVNHFDPNYFADGQFWGIPDLEASEIGFEKAKKTFEADGREILDATIDGKLEIFNKISIEEALDIISNKPD